MTAPDDLSSSLSRSDETRRRILQAAAQVFAEKGYARATTRAIAAAADVNEVTLFRHFGSKKRLLLAVIEQYSALQDFQNLAQGFTGDYRQDLHQFGAVLHRAITQRREAMRLMLCEAAEVSELRDVMVRVPQQLRRLTADYLRGQMALGKVRPMDPDLMAQAFLGMFFAYGVAREILSDPDAPAAADETVIAQFVDIFVQGTADDRAEAQESGQ